MVTSGWSLVYMALESVVYFALVFAIEKVSFRLTPLGIDSELVADPCNMCAQAIANPALLARLRCQNTRAAIELSEKPVSQIVPVRRRVTELVWRLVFVRAVCGGRWGGGRGRDGGARAAAAAVGRRRRRGEARHDPRGGVCLLLLVVSCAHLLDLCL